MLVQPPNRDLVFLTFGCKGRPLVVMKASWSIFLGLLYLTGLPVFAGELSEQAAMQKVKDIPEFKAYAKQREFAFDDNEPITVAGSWNLPKEVELPAWRLDVHTVVKDDFAPHTSLWARFFVSASGRVFVWERMANQIISLEQWQATRRL